MKIVQIHLVVSICSFLTDRQKRDKSIADFQHAFQSLGRCIVQTVLLGMLKPFLFSIRKGYKAVFKALNWRRIRKQLRVNHWEKWPFGGYTSVLTNL